MLRTRLTERLGLRHPIIGAPMAFAAGGRLAAAISKTGALGLIGGGYGDANWLKREFDVAGDLPVGCGFITWSMRKQPAILDVALARNPKAIFLSFGDPAPFAARIKNRGLLLICQIQTRKDALRALDCGADIIVAQGSEAGGHGEKRGTFALIPEIADVIANQSPNVLLCAAGGVADGRGIAAALMLGADGVVVGSRFWASEEATVSARMHAVAVGATGDDTIRSQLMDMARKLDWPSRYTARVLRNQFIKRWQGREEELRAAADEVALQYQRAWTEGNPDESNTFVGEVVGLIHQIEPVGKIIERMAGDAARLIDHAGRHLNGIGST